MQIVRSGNGDANHLGRTWFEFVTGHPIRSFSISGITSSITFSGAHFFNLFQSIGSAGALYSVLAPYL